MVPPLLTHFTTHSLVSLPNHTYIPVRGCALILTEIVTVLLLASPWPNSKVSTPMLRTSHIICALIYLTSFALESFEFCCAPCSFAWFACGFIRMNIRVCEHISIQCMYMSIWVHVMSVWVYEYLRSRQYEYVSILLWLYLWLCLCCLLCLLLLCFWWCWFRWGLLGLYGMCNNGTWVHTCLHQLN